MTAKQAFFFVVGTFGHMGTLYAQPTEATQPGTSVASGAIEFIEGEPRPVDLRPHALAVVTVVAEFETELLKSREYQRSSIWQDAFRATGNRVFRPTGVIRFDQFIVRTPTPSDAPTKDRWTVYAPDERTLHDLIAAIDRHVVQKQERLIETYRASLPGMRQNLTVSRERLAEAEQQLSAAQAQYDEVKIDGFTVAAADRLIADLVHESRLVEIDVAGLEAQTAEIRNRSEKLDQNARAMRDQLASLQMKLDIELIGKFARRAAIHRQIEQITQARERLTRINAAEERIEKHRAYIPQTEKSIESWQSFLERTSREPGLPIIGNRVTVHRIIVEEDKN